MTRSLFARRSWERFREAVTSPGALLVGVDLDGTIAPLRSHPDEARVLPRVLELLAETARAHRTHVAIVSARPISSIRRLAPVAGVCRIGQYGLEGSLAPETEKRPALRAAATELARMAARAVAPVPGAWVEWKGFTVAVHDRAVTPAHRATLHRAVQRLIPSARLLGFRPLRGSRVVDFVPAGFDKGVALAGVRRTFRPDVTLYVGDSPSDEHAFRILGERDFSVRVGRGPTLASFRVTEPADVARILSAVVRWRTRVLSAPRR